MTARLRNNLNAALDEPLPLPVALKGFERHVAEHMPNPFDRFDNVRQSWGE
jgi:hypothetical protein